MYPEALPPGDSLEAEGPAMCAPHGNLLSFVLSCTAQEGAVGQRVLGWDGTCGTAQVLRAAG